MYYTRQEIINKFASEYTLVAASYQNVKFVLLVNDNNEVKRYLYEVVPGQYWMAPEKVTLDDFLADGWTISAF